jgi:hypothetical protein
MFRRVTARLCFNVVMAEQGKKLKPTADDVKKRKTLDDVLKNVLDEALAARDRGENADSDFVYKRTHEKMYEAEYGRAPPSKSNTHLNHIPPEPATDVRRLVPVDLFDDDPWPQPSWSAYKEIGEKTASKDDAAGAASSEGSEVEVEAAAVERDPVADFSDAADEIGHWEVRYVEFLRNHTLGLRRTLPVLVEQYKLLTHRLLRAERRFLNARDKAVGSGKRLEPKDYAVTEAIIERIRKIYSETHKSLTQNSYDPTNMNRSVTGALLQMTPEQYEDWKTEVREERNRVMSSFEDSPLAENEEQQQPAPAKEETMDDRLSSLPRGSPKREGYTPL